LIYETSTHTRKICVPFGIGHNIFKFQIRVVIGLSTLTLYLGHCNPQWSDGWFHCWLQKEWKYLLIQSLEQISGVGRALSQWQAKLFRAWLVTGKTGLGEQSRTLTTRRNPILFYLFFNIFFKINFFFNFKKKVFYSKIWVPGPLPWQFQHGNNRGKIIFFAEKKFPWGTSATAGAALPGLQNFSNVIKEFW